MEKRIEFSPAFDKRNHDPKKNYGIHGVDIRFVLIGERGAVQFVLYTNWYLPHVADDLWTRHPAHLRAFFGPMPPADVGYHSPVPQYEGQEPIGNNCQYLNGPCYYDGSGLRANDAFKVLVEEGDDGLWKYLEQYYRDTFGE